MLFHVGAYAMSPCGTVWDPALEADFIEGLKALPFVAGLELPHFSTLDRWDEDFLFRHADPRWDYVVSTLPSLSVALRTNPNFGLASSDDASRSAAIEGIRVANASCRRANDRLGRRAVRAIEIHSGPPEARLKDATAANVFARSLEEIGGWDWDGAEVIVEHCDAAVPGQPYQKGFLSIDEEVAAIAIANRHLDRPIAASINWGRSVIEGRSPTIVARHIAVLVESGLMRGLIFSGCSSTDNAFGAWQDTHMPHGPESYVSAYEEGALLSEREMRLALAQTSGEQLAFLGIKIAARPLDAPLRRRLDLLESALKVLASAYLATC